MCHTKGQKRVWVLKCLFPGASWGHAAFALYHNPYINALKNCINDDGVSVN